MHLVLGSRFEKMVSNQEKLNNMTEAQKQRQDMVENVIQMVNSLFSRMVKNLEPLIPIDKIYCITIFTTWKTFLVL